MKDQVLSIDQCKELVALGIDMSGAHVWWLVNTASSKGRAENLIPPYLAFHNSTLVVGLTKFKYIPTFTLQDILEMLPKRIEMPTWEVYQLQIKPVCDNKWRVGYLEVHYEEDILIKAAFGMLKWCKQNNYL